MTGRCYYCAAEEHHECRSKVCRCCGERNQQHQKDVDALEAAIREAMRTK